MAFKDMQVILYDGTVKINYLDSSHRYYMRPRKLDENGNFLIEDENNPKAWGKASRPKGTTTILGDTLEKKGLMKYALQKTLMDLFGFYRFRDDDGKLVEGYSKKGVARLFNDEGRLIDYTREEAMEHIGYGAEASDRWTKKGADIGSVVHDAIEHYVKGQPFDIRADYKNSIDNAEYENDFIRDLAYEEYAEDVNKAELAFKSFCEWWDQSGIELLGAEDLIYSKKYHICGTFDGLLNVPGKGRVLADWKTSNATQSKDASMLEGINYQYFIQSAIYAMVWEEMGHEPIDDLAIVSCRKDGGFTVIYASDLGLSMEDMLNWVRAVIICSKMMAHTKEQLWEHGVANGAYIDYKAIAKAKKEAA